MVFITIPWFSPAFRAGGPIQSISNLVNNFTENIEYRIFCGDSDLNGEPLNNVTKSEWLSFNKVTHVWYAPKENLSDTLTKQVNLLKPDVIYMVGIFSWHFNLVPWLFCKAPLKIISVRGMLHPGARSQKKWKKIPFLFFLKNLAKVNKVIFQATDAEELKYITALFGKEVSVKIAGNFAKQLLPQQPPLKSAGTLNMVTVALISPMKNHLMVLEALKHCTAQINYTIYGPIKDAVYWLQCIDAIALLPQNVTVNYAGEIAPDNIENVLAHNHVFIMPSKSENFGHALSEAFAAGKPVITSNNTPWNNLAVNNVGFNVALEISEITNAINYFSNLNNEAYLDIVNNIPNFYLQHNNIAQTKKEYQNLFFNN